jgi:hypothetical protein
MPRNGGSLCQGMWQLREINALLNSRQPNDWLLRDSPFSLRFRRKYLSPTNPRIAKARI